MNKYLLCLALIVIVFGALRTQRAGQAPKSDREKAFAIRTAAAGVLFALVFVALLFVLPNKGKVLMLLPAFFLALSLGKAWHATRERLRRKEQDRVDFERMKRVAPLR